MKIKRVLRYYCGFCGKSGGGRYAMELHEKHCTMNPNRVCRMCEKMEEEQVSINKLIAALPEVIVVDDFGDITTSVEGDLKTVRAISNNCPACILAAIRQSGHFSLEFGFDYKKECKKFWNDLNNQEET